MGLLNGKVALVTGGGQGIGRAVCTEFAAEGASVAVIDIDTANAAETASQVEAAGQKAITVQCDVSNRGQVDAAVQATVDAFGTIDVLVNVAIAGAPRVPLLETTEALFESMHRTGPLATMFFMQACHPYLKGGGSIINFASGGGYNGDIGYAAYAPAKEGVRVLSKVAARELGPDGIRVNNIFPSARTRLMEAWIEEDPSREEDLRSTIPLRRLGEAVDVAKGVVFLASDYAGYVSGHTLAIDGGSCKF